MYTCRLSLSPAGSWYVFVSVSLTTYPHFDPFRSFAHVHSFIHFAGMHAGRLIVESYFLPTDATEHGDDVEVLQLQL